MVLRIIVACLLFAGCSHRTQPKGWLSVEKAPMRVILVDNEKDIDINTVNMVISHFKGVKYNACSFNSDTKIGIMFDAKSCKQDILTRDIKWNQSEK